MTLREVIQIGFFVLVIGGPIVAWCFSRRGCLKCRNCGCNDRRDRSINAYAPEHGRR